MSISQAEVDLMERDAALWWEGLALAEQMRVTGGADGREADRRFFAVSLADRWHLSQGHTHTIGIFKW
jgi:hypothetical protein